MSALDYLAMLGPIAFVAAFLLTPWGQGLAAFLLGTRLGRWISIAAVVVYAGLVAYSATKGGLDAATRLVLLDSLSAATGEITRDLVPGSVDLRLRGRDVEFVVAAARAEQDEDATTATGLLGQRGIDRRQRGPADAVRHAEGRRSRHDDRGRRP